MEESKTPHTVLITTSGTGNRLGNITQYTNKSLVRIGKKPAISYIIERYPKDTEFVVTIGYFGDQVEQFLKLVYSDRNIKLCKVDNYVGWGSSLVYSMNCAKEFLQKPFIIHVCDTIVLDKFEDVEGNWCASAERSHTEHYRTHNVQDGKLNLINEKGSSDAKFAHIGLVKINDYKEFWDEVRVLLRNFAGDTSLSDCHVINSLLKRGKKFKIVKIYQWLDIGNIQSLHEARQAIPDKFDILDKDGESIFIFDDKFVVKFFNDKKHVRNRILRLGHLKSYGPKLLGNTDNFYVYEYVRGLEASHYRDCETFRNLLSTMFNDYWSVIDTSDDFFEKTRVFYFDKTLSRANQFLMASNIQDEPVVVNGTRIEKFETLLNSIPANVLCTNKKYYYHGDFVLDNIIIGNSGVKFIDWRQDFCGEVDGGDVYYDLGKLNHSLVINHDLVSRNLFTIKEIEGQSIKTMEVEILRKSCHVEFEKILHQFMADNKFDIRKVNLLTALIWINMSPLHHHPFNNFLYYFGLYNLNKHLNEI